MIASIQRMVFLFFLVLFSSTAAYGITLVKEGKATATIVIRDSALKSEAFKPVRGQSGMPDAKIKLAALDLQKYLEKMSGAKLEIVADGSMPSGPVILVGPSTMTEKLSNLKIPSGLTPERNE